MSSNITTSEGTNVKRRADELGLQSPEEFSIVPHGMADAESIDDLLHQDEAITIRKVIKEEGIEETPIDEYVSLNIYHTRSAEIAGPIIYFSAEFIANNWGNITAIILAIRSYFVARNAKNISMEFYCETDNEQSTVVKYEGPPENLGDVTDAISEIKNQGENKSTSEETERNV